MYDINTHEKLENVVRLLKHNVIDPDIDIDYCIPEVNISSKECDVWDQPYIIIRYTVDENNVPWKIIRFTKHYLEYPAEKIVNLINFTIEQFISEVEKIQTERHY